jgi:hypothetical protein
MTPGVPFRRVVAGSHHAAALRSDGSVAAWGNNRTRQCEIPPLASGQRYELIACTVDATFLWRSDGVLVQQGTLAAGTPFVARPAVMPARTRRAVADFEFALELLRDGTVVAWGRNQYRQCDVPPLPWGVSFVDVAADNRTAMALRSDGELAVWGDVSSGQDRLPELPQGAGWLQVAAGLHTVAARYGARASYVRLAPGCAGTAPASRLVPADLPRVGARFELEVTNLPVDLVLLVGGLDPTGTGQLPAPTPLAAFGLPGCSWYPALDALVLLAGQGGQATWSIDIPAQPLLLGVELFQQAIVFDPAANAAGAVVSDAARLRVGGR